ncbi:MAG: hypothetical protein ACK2T0_10935 [Anaerolineales bacterium]
MSLLLLKLVLTPALIGAASLAGRKWGHAISGWLVALPLTTGPIVFLLALTHGSTFAAHTAAGILAGGFSLAAFVLVYGRAAPRLTWLPTLTLATLAFGLMTLILENITLPVLPLWAGVVAGFLLVMQLLPRGLNAHEPVAALPGRWDIPLRMILATTFVLLITGLAPALGPHLAGLLSPFPLFTATLAAFGQHLYGAAAAIKVLHGLLMGLFSYATFMLTLILLLQPAGIALAFAAAIAVTAAIQAGTLWLLRRGTD